MGAASGKVSKVFKEIMIMIEVFRDIGLGCVGV